MCHFVAKDVRFRTMLIETTEGYDYSSVDFDIWALQAGFSSTYILPLNGPTSTAVAIK